MIKLTKVQLCKFSTIFNIFCSIILGLCNYKAHAQEGFLGISFQGMDSRTASALGLKEAIGVLIRDIALGGPADLAGFRRGDLLIEYANQKIDNVEKLVKVAAQTKPKQKIQATIIRNEERINLELILAARDASWSVKDEKTLYISEIGLTLTGITTKIRDRFDLRWGALGLLVTLVNPDPTKTMALKRGDLIVQINQKPIWTIEQFDTTYRRAQKENRASLLILVERRGNFKFFILPVRRLN